MALMMDIFCATASSASGDRLSEPKPNQMGVPTAPVLTGTELNVRHRLAALSLEKPRSSSSGAAMAPGVPKPLVPSIRKAKAHAISSAWDIGPFVWRAVNSHISCKAAVCRSAPNRISAPMTTIRGVSELHNATSASGRATSVSAEYGFAARCGFFNINRAKSRT